MQTQVLVIGAGPVGLTSAIALVQAGIEVTIVDAAEAGKNGSRAAVLHANTLEELRSIGLADLLVQESVKGIGYSMYDGPHRFLHMSWSCLTGKTNYPYFLLLAQHDTERILASRLTNLGVNVQWKHRAVSIAGGDSGVTVGFENGSTITARYVVGADGSRSSVRTLVGLSFANPATGVPFHDVDHQHNPASNWLTLVDVGVRGPVPPSWVRDNLSFHYGEGFFLTIPLPSPTYLHSMVPGEGELSFWRIAANNGAALPPKPMTLEYVQSQVDRVQDDLRVEIAVLLDGNRYRERCAVAEQFYKPLGSGHVLLVGDAAHVHSPAGAQGLNLGMCDALALAKTISSHTENHDDQVLLNYTTSRHTRAIQIIKLSGSSLWLLTRIRNSTFFRRWVVGFILNRLESFKAGVVWRLSGLGANATAAK